MVELSVVVPVFNSEACLDELARQVGHALRDWTYELILVDDQSADRSWSVIKILCEHDKSIIGIRLRKNAGQDNAILCGLRRACGRFVAVMDDDLQHSPYDIPVLLAQCKASDWDVCYACFPQKKQAWWKNCGSWLNGKLANIVIGKPGNLYLSPFKVIRREIVAEIIKYTGAFSYVDGLIIGVTHQVGQVDVMHHKRYQGEGNYGVFKSLLVSLRVATGFSVWPLRFASCLGVLSSAGGFALAFFYLIQYMFWDHRVEGWVTLVILQLVIGGLLLFAIGVVGEYLGRLYLNSNGRPQSTIKETCNG